jgi:hypothetical protein
MSESVQVMHSQHLLQVDSTESGSAHVAGGRFGTGFNSGRVTSTASTYLDGDG